MVCAAKDAGAESGYIYALVDPRDGTARYIGQTIHLSNRLAVHLDAREVTEKCVWIRGLLRVGLAPEMVVLATCPTEDLDAEEMTIIAGLRATGAMLYNIADGGHICSRPRFRPRIVRAPRPPKPRAPRPAPHAVVEHLPEANEDGWFPIPLDTQQETLSAIQLRSLILTGKRIRFNQHDPNRAAQRIERWFSRKGKTFDDYLASTPKWRLRP